MYEDFRNRMSRRGSYMGETMRNQSNAVVNATWLNSVAARPVQVKWLNYGLPPEYLSPDDFEEPLDAHFELKSSYSLNSGESPYYLTFRPGELMRHPEIKVGAYVSIPNVDSIPEWWMIVFIEDDNELKKLYILKCNYQFGWVANGKIYKCLGVLRNGNGGDIDSNSYSTTVDGSLAMFVPTNSDTVTIGYNQRFLISDKRRQPPLAWQVSKLEDTQPIGLTKIRFAQNTYDPSHDNAELMLADYYTNAASPEDSNPDLEIASMATITYNGANPTVKVGGSYKLFTASFSDENVEVDKWFISDENGDISADTSNYTIEYLGNQMKLKVAQNYNLIGKVLIIKLVGSDGSTAELRVEVI